jgi:hypothetical protein
MLSTVELFKVRFFSLPKRIPLRRTAKSEKGNLSVFQESVAAAQESSSFLCLKLN